MLTTWKSLVLPILDYCSQLWCPISKGEIRKLERIQQSFTRKISGQNGNYWERLKQLQLYSLERRRERYRILYTWKILENHVPNPAVDERDGLRKHHSARTGVTVRLPVYNRKIPTKVWKLKEGSLPYQGAKLFNCLPKQLRGMTGCSLQKFKKCLDAFLKTISDEPMLQGYPGSVTLSNSLTKVTTVQPGNCHLTLPSTEADKK